MRWLQPRSAIVVVLMVSAALVGCTAGNDDEISTRATVSPSACPGQRGALATIPPVAARDRLKDSPSHYAPVVSLAQLPFRSTNVARVLDRVQTGLDPAVRMCAAITDHGPGAGFPGPWMIATARIASAEPAARIYGEWQIDLLAGASAELFNVTGQKRLGNVLVGVTPRLIPADKPGSLPVAGRLGAIAAGQQFLSSRLSDTQTVSAVTRVVHRSGATVVSLDVWHPLGKAVSVTVRVKDLAAFRRTGWNALVRSSLQSPAEFEGVYLKVDAPDGTPLACFSSASRFGAGSQWESPSAGFGYPHG